MLLPSKTAESPCDGDDGRTVNRAPVGRHDELVLVILDDGLGPLAEREARLERRRLLHEAVHEVTRQDLRVSGDVEDGLLGIDLGALAARLRQGVNQVALELEQARFEYGEQTARSRSDDEDVRLDHDRLRGEGSFHTGCQGNNGKAPVFTP